MPFPVLSPIPLLFIPRHGLDHVRTCQSLTAWLLSQGVGVGLHLDPGAPKPSNVVHATYGTATCCGAMISMRAACPLRFVLKQLTLVRLLLAFWVF